MPEVNPAPVALPRRLLAEAIGTGLLVTVVVGSGIAAQQLSPGNTGLQLLENSTATVFGLAVLILMFGPVSGAHFNPVVTAADWLLGRRTSTGIAGVHVAPYIAVQTSAPSPGPCWPTPCSNCPSWRSPARTGPAPGTGSGRSSPPPDLSP